MSSQTEPLISVIVPIFNVEDYLEACLESILAQTFTGFELILVDDGSTDRCPAVCDCYREDDNRIIVIHQPNGGISQARNTGIDICKGTYIAFIDSDDAVAPDYLETLYQDIRTSDADVAICGWRSIHEEKAFIYEDKQKTLTVMDRTQAMSALLYQRKFDNSAWGKLFRTTLFKDVRFPVGKLFEDIAVMYRIFDNAGRVSHNAYTGYYYRKRSSGIMLSSFNEKKLDLLDAADALLGFVSRHYPELEPAAESRLVRANMQILLQLPADPRYDGSRRRTTGNIRRYRGRVLKDKEAKFGTKAALLISYFGFSNVRRLRFLKRLGKL